MSRKSDSGNESNKNDWKVEEEELPKGRGIDAEPALSDSKVSEKDEREVIEVGSEGDGRREGGIGEKRGEESEEAVGRRTIQRRTLSDVGSPLSRAKRPGIRHSSSFAKERLAEEFGIGTRRMKSGRKRRGEEERQEMDDWQVQPGAGRGKQGEKDEGEEGEWKEEGEEERGGQGEAKEEDESRAPAFAVAAFAAVAASLAANVAVSWAPGISEAKEGVDLEKGRRRRGEEEEGGRKRREESEGTIASNGLNGSTNGVPNGNHQGTVALIGEPRVRNLPRVVNKKKKSWMALILAYLIQMIPPIFSWSKKYELKWFLKDAVAGLSCGVYGIPQAMALGVLAGLTPVDGLYTLLAPSVVYILMGPSRSMSVGPSSVGSLLVGNAVANVIANSTSSSVDPALVATCMAFFMGIIFLALSFLRLGFLAAVISRPVVVGFTAAAALIVDSTQVKHMLGLKGVPSNSQIIDWFKIMIPAIRKGPINGYAFLMSLTCLFILVSIKFFPRLKIIPGPVVVSVGAILVTWGFSLNEKEGGGGASLVVIGNIPSGLPVPRLPFPSSSDLSAAVSALPIIACVALVELVSISKTFAVKAGTIINANSELLALGAAATIGSFFRSYPISASFSRTALNDSTGAKSQFSNVVSVVIVIFVLLFASQAVYFLPMSTLAAIVIAATLSLFDIDEAYYILKTSKRDFLILLVAFLVTLLAGPAIGVLAPVCLNIFFILLDQYRMKTRELAQVPNALTDTLFDTIHPDLMSAEAEEMGDEEERHPGVIPSGQGLMSSMGGGGNHHTTGPSRGGGTTDHSGFHVYHPLSNHPQQHDSAAMIEVIEGLDVRNSAFHNPLPSIPPSHPSSSKSLQRSQLFGPQPPPTSQFHHRDAIYVIKDYFPDQSFTHPHLIILRPTDSLTYVNIDNWVMHVVSQALERLPGQWDLGNSEEVKELRVMKKEYDDEQRRARRARVRRMRRLGGLKGAGGSSGNFHQSESFTASLNKKSTATGGGGAAAVSRRGRSRSRSRADSTWKSERQESTHPVVGGVSEVVAVATGADDDQTPHHIDDGYELDDIGEGYVGRHVDRSSSRRRSSMRRRIEGEIPSSSSFPSRHSLNPSATRDHRRHHGNQNPSRRRMEATTSRKRSSIKGSRDSSSFSSSSVTSEESSSSSSSDETTRMNEDDRRRMEEDEEKERKRRRDEKRAKRTAIFNNSSTHHHHSIEGEEGSKREKEEEGGSPKKPKEEPSSPSPSPHLREEGRISPPSFKTKKLLPRAAEEDSADFDDEDEYETRRRKGRNGGARGLKNIPSSSLAPSSPGSIIDDGKDKDAHEESEEYYGSFDEAEETSDKVSSSDVRVAHRHSGGTSSSASSSGDEGELKKRRKEEGVEEDGNESSNSSKSSRGSIYSIFSSSSEHSLPITEGEGSVVGRGRRKESMEVIGVGVGVGVGGIGGIHHQEDAEDDVGGGGGVVVSSKKKGKKSSPKGKTSKSKGKSSKSKEKDSKSKDSNGKSKIKSSKSKSKKKKKEKKDKDKSMPRVATEDSLPSYYDDEDPFFYNDEELMYFDDEEEEEEGGGGGMEEYEEGDESDSSFEGSESEYYSEGDLEESFTASVSRTGGGGGRRRRHKAKIIARDGVLRDATNDELPVGVDDKVEEESYRREIKEYAERTRNLQGFVIIDMIHMNSMDSIVVGRLRDLHITLAINNISLAIARPRPSTLKYLIRGNFVSLIGQDFVVDSVNGCVIRCNAVLRAARRFQSLKLIEAEEDEERRILKIKILKRRRALLASSHPSPLHDSIIDSKKH